MEHNDLSHKLILRYRRVYNELKTSEKNETVETREIIHSGSTTQEVKLSLNTRRWQRTNYTINGNTSDKQEKI